MATSTTTTGYQQPNHAQRAMKVFVADVAFTVDRNGPDAAARMCELKVREVEDLLDQADDPATGMLRSLWIAGLTTEELETWAEQLRRRAHQLRRRLA